MTISLEQYGAQGLNGTLYEMKGYGPEDENSFDDPEKVTYTERPFRAEKPEFEHVFEPCSLSVFRFHA